MNLRDSTLLAVLQVLESFSRQARLNKNVFLKVSYDLGISSSKSLVFHIITNPFCSNCISEYGIPASIASSYKFSIVL